MCNYQIAIIVQLALCSNETAMLEVGICYAVFQVILSK